MGGEVGTVTWTRRGKPQLWWPTFPGLPPWGGRTGGPATQSVTTQSREGGPFQVGSLSKWKCPHPVALKVLCGDMRGCRGWRGLRPRWQLRSHLKERTSAAPNLPPSPVPLLGPPGWTSCRPSSLALGSVSENSCGSNQFPPTWGLQTMGMYSL